MKTPILLFVLLGLVVVNTTYAEETNIGKKTPSVNQVIEVLKKTRSINLGGLKPKEKKPVEQEAALSMEILFSYNSAQLTEEAKNQLRPVGEAMRSEQLKTLNFIVEGHTDAIGGEVYNKNLSLERAASVKQYLVDTFQLDSSRFKVEGKGKSNLLDPKNPESEVNRRVRIVRVN
jgi:OmpA-OmpF porin, OOP family